MASEKRAFPETYKEAIYLVGSLDFFSEEVMEKLANYTVLKNILAHKYLDIRWKRINEFLKNSKPYLENFLESVKNFIEK